MQLNHSFKLFCYDPEKLLKKCNTISLYSRRLEKQAYENTERFHPDLYKGRGFECLCEAMFKLMACDNRIGIYNYGCVGTVDDTTLEKSDTGVDGFGKNFQTGLPMTVQLKYRGDHTSVITSTKDALSNFTTSSFIHYGVDPALSNHMLIVTTAKGMHYYTEQTMFQNKVRCIGWAGLRELLDENKAFWDSYRSLMGVVE